jgi:nickel/cobalt exporter
MSVTADPGTLSGPAGTRIALRLALAIVAVALVAGAAALLVWLFVPAVAPPPRSPFGMGMREGAPAASGLGGAILALQSSFYRALQAALSGVRDSGAALWTLIGLGFAYGVFHAAGPGHGKAVISAYLLANERSLARGISLSLAAALVQAFGAILLVGVATALLKATAAGLAQATTRIELVSFAAVAALGAVMTWRKAGKLAGVAALARNPLAGPQGDSCDHVHLPGPEFLERLAGWREWAATVLAAGIRPCAGALIVLVFALSQGLFAAGVAATLAMALGTAVTTGLFAALAVFAKRLALRLAGGRGASGAVALAGIELLAAAFVLVLGTILVAGLWSGAGS